jgi:hypothetical protein
MIEKRYQVFVSSTFQDLQEERQEVIQALLELDCIPAGMELFPAADEDQWTLIRDVIDNSDYYIVIMGGRYGSIGPRDISYTEMEYRYAVEAGKPVLAFLHKDPTSLPVSRVDSDPHLQEKLRSFRGLAQQKMCRFWTSPSELGGLVSRSMVRLIKHSPAVGWVRADQLPSSNTVQELLEARRRLETVEAKLREAVEGANSVGLVRAVGRQGDFGTESDWLALLSGAVERVDLMGRTLYGWTQSADAAELIKRKIQEERVHFRWLVMSTENPFLPVLEENRVNIETYLRNKLESVERFLGRIRESLPDGCRELLEVRCFESVPLYFGYVRVDDNFFVTHYLSSANSTSSPMLCLNDVGAAWSRAYAREFDTVWRLSSASIAEPHGCSGS